MCTGNNTSNIIIMVNFGIIQLVLRDNDISEVPKTIYRCAKLKTLHLQVNQINVLPPELSMYSYSLSLSLPPLLLLFCSFPIIF